MRNLLALITIITMLLGDGYCQRRNAPKTLSTEYQDSLLKYKLIKKVPNADFNYEKLSDFSKSVKSEAKGGDIVNIFEPVGGNFTYYQFIAEGIGEFLTFPGEANKVRKFHDILILKTDATGRILDGFQYTLEWGEYPFEYDLFRISNSEQTLQNNLKIEVLKLKNLYEKRNFEDGGIIEIEN